MSNHTIKSERDELVSIMRDLIKTIDNATAQYFSLGEINKTTALDLESAADNAREFLKLIED